MTGHKTIYVIIDTETGEFVSINNKAAWVKVGNAKNAWNIANHYRYNPPKLFADQDQYVIKAINCEEQQ